MKKEYFILLPAIGIIFAATSTPAQQVELETVRLMTSLDVAVLGRPTNLFLLVIAGTIGQSVGLLLTQIPHKVPAPNASVTGIGAGINIISNGFLVSPIQELQALPLQQGSLIAGGLIMFVGIGFSMVNMSTIRIEPEEDT